MLSGVQVDRHGSPDALALYESLGFSVVGTLVTAPPDPH